MTPVAAGNVTGTTGGAAISLSSIPDGIGFYSVELRNDDTSNMAYLSVVTTGGLAQNAQAYELPAAAGSASKDATNIRRLGPFPVAALPYIVAPSGSPSVHYVVEAWTDEAP